MTPRTVFWHMHGVVRTSVHELCADAHNFANEMVVDRKARLAYMYDPLKNEWMKYVKAPKYLYCKWESVNADAVPKVYRLLAMLEES